MHKGVSRWNWLLLVCLLSSCASEPIKAPVGDRSRQPVRNPDSHRVRQGDTLYSVAFLYGYSVDELVAWNRLHKPYVIFKGQQLQLRPPPVAAKKSLPKPVRQAPQASQPKPYHPPAGSKTVPPAAPHAAVRAEPIASPQARLATSGHVIWSWPVNGRLISDYNTKSAGKKGINIAGKNGDPVRAAAAGKVVYSGSGLSGYGRLIIIKHNKDFLSAYAHNRQLIAGDGQWVRKGEVIARMGRSGTDRTQLHFEIRKRGRPVNPLRYLPER
ncbi:MAG: peptidoglycan DD-metalloendopeptidase family protein [Gammaproteobacteria bacterium]|nr:MAG: peptidoglycan DD-metalloendopeptidase family protein [Gammaproteobacteria bacterium]